MARNPIKSIPLVFLIFLFLLSPKASTSFSVDLIHRDFLHSPPANSRDTFQRIRTALQRSHDRVKLHHHHHHHHPHNLVTEAEIVPDKGSYVMKFSIGTPRFETAAIADTGSDLTWIQCKPCIECFEQDFPIFEPRKSSSYKTVSCDSKLCHSPDLTTSCGGATNTCGYKLLYGDRSYSRGDVATETLILGTTKIKNIVMGCGHANRGTFGTKTSGIVGLGGGNSSLISQLGPKIQHKFSYCLVPFFKETPNPSSKLHFGQDAVVSGHGVVSTPFILKGIFYFLTLEAVSVGPRRLNLLRSSVSESDGSAERGNIIIDSGTTLTYLPTEFYSEVRRAVKSLTKLPETRDPTGMLDLCFVVEVGVGGGDEEFRLPALIMHFQGADVELRGENSYLRTTEASVCLTFMPGVYSAIYGNIAQGDFLVGYDLEKKTVSFKHTDCAGK